MFNFKFVDREIERKLIKKFISASSIDKILWIHGESGVGKTELMKYFTNQSSQNKYIHVNPIKNQTGSYISILIKELEKENYSLLNYIIRNYKQIKDLVKNTISEINGKTKFLISGLEIGEKIFIDANQEFFSVGNVLTKYISIISQKDSLIFIFDNFQQCDLKSLEIIQEISQNLLGKQHIKFIFITTDNLITSDSEIIEFLTEKITGDYIRIEPFKQKEYFLDILLDIYKLDNITNPEMDCLFQICKGIPEKLKIFLRNMYLAHGIKQYGNNPLPQFDANIFADTLEKGVENIDFEALDILQKLTLKIMFCWNESITFKLLEDVMHYVCDKVLYMPNELSQQINLTIYSLLNLHILEFNGDRLKLKHDLLYTICIIKYNVIPDEILYNELYCYININKGKIVEEYSQTYYDLNNALYAYRAKVYSWEEINLQCLKMLIQQSNYQQIDIIIERLKECFNKLNVADLILLAECFYNSGKYDQARKILDEASKKLVNDTECFNYYYLSGKLYNIMMDKNNAEKELLLANNYVIPGSDEEIFVKHMLQLVIVEVRGRKEEAKEIFSSVSEHLDNYNSNSKALGIILKNCSNYYSGEKALFLLDKALTISEAQNNLVEKAYIKNNMGYEFFKLNNYEKCKSLYTESLDILAQTKIHESAYPLSNLAVCNMIDNKYSEALTLIKRAIFWNRSSYLKFVLDTHLMLCYQQIGQNEKSYEIAESLFNKLETVKINDPVILRKVYLNLAINYDKLEYPQYARICAQRAYPVCIGSSSEYRASQILKKYGGSPKNELRDLKEQYCTKFYFDHWLTIFSHD